MRKLVIILIYLSIFQIVSIDAQESETGALSYSDVIDLSEQYDLEFQPVFLSASGTHLAYVSSGELCIVSIDTADVLCHLIPTTFDARPHSLFWSPDGQYIAFHQIYTPSLYEPDIWVFRVKDASFQNLTDDKVEARDYVSEADRWIDDALTWGPDNKIYVARVILESGNRYIFEGVHLLMQIDPSTGEVSVISDLRDSIPAGSIYDYFNYSLDGIMSVSPDLTKLAVRAVAYNESSEDANGLWLIDLTGRNEPRFIASSFDFRKELPRRYSTSGIDFWIRGIAWDASGSGLFVDSFDPVSTISALHHIDLTTSEIVSMMDLSHLPINEIMQPDLTNEDFPSPYYFPKGASLTPDRNSLIFVHGRLPVRSFSITTFDGTFSVPEFIYSTDVIETHRFDTQIGQNGNLIHSHLLFLNNN